MQQLFALSLGIAAMVFAASQSNAQTVSTESTAQCAVRSEVVTVLATRDKETRHSIGLAAGNQMMEIYASDAGSWSILFTRADGLACLVASGQNFETLSEPLALKDPPA